MFLQLAHTKLNVFVVSKEFILSCYKAGQSFPREEKFSMVQQIRTAFSVHLNVAEGCLRRSVAERMRSYEVARGSIIEVDALDIVVKLGYTSPEKLTELGALLRRSFQLISRMIS